MVKHILLLINFFVLMLFNAFFGEDVKVTQNIPSKTDPGTEFTVELTIQKGSIAGFAKIQQDLPAGFTATAIESKGASFTFNDQKVKMIWMALPPENEFTISYKVTVNADVAGTFQIGGKLSYLEENERKTYNFQPHEIQVGEVSVASGGGTEEETLPLEAVCSRAFTMLNENEYKVEITIENQGITGFAKVQETIPAGVKAGDGFAKDAVFTFVDHKVKFVWMSVPTDEQFTISYVVKLDGTSASELNNIAGEFSFLDNNATRKIDIATTVPVTELVTEVTTEETTTEETTTTEEETAEAEAKRLAEEEARIAAETKRLADAEAAAEAKRLAEEEAAKKAAEETALTSTPAPQTGISYRVQIAAGHKTVPGSHFRDVYNYSASAIQNENHEGWIKYTINSFDIYKSARGKRNEVTSGYDFPGPFVTAYNTGQRITVQEALMISNQKWFQ